MMAKRFNPFAPVSSKYGAPMGRCSDNPANLQGIKVLRAKHQGMKSSGYDSGGAYWGSPNDVWGVWAWIDGAPCVVYVRAANRESAINQVRNGI